MVKFVFGGDCTGHVVLDNLQFVDVIGRKVKVKRVTVIKLGVDKRGSNIRGSGKVQSGANTTEVSNVKESASVDG